MERNSLAHLLRQGDEVSQFLALRADREIDVQVVLDDGISAQLKSNSLLLLALYYRHFSEPEIDFSDVRTIFPAVRLHNR